LIQGFPQGIFVAVDQGLPGRSAIERTMAPCHPLGGETSIAKILQHHASQPVVMPFERLKPIQ
jgi:hypothetical protein